MQLEISGFSHVAIRVTDLQRARRFYVDVLGLPVALELEGVVLVKTGSGLLGIRADAAGAKPGDRFDPYRVGLDHLSFAVDTVESLERMKRDLDGARIPNDGIHDEPALNAKKPCVLRPRRHRHRALYDLEVTASSAAYEGAARAVTQRFLP